MPVAAPVINATLFCSRGNGQCFLPGSSGPDHLTQIASEDNSDRRSLFLTVESGIEVYVVTDAFDRERGTDQMPAYHA
jgi:hypothetical protein